MPPEANAGDDVTVALPTKTVTLDGSRSKDDLKIVTYSWKMISGDETSVRLTGSETPTLRLDELNPGTYVFELLVIDSLGQSDTDIVEVNVTGYMHNFLNFYFFIL